MAGPYTIHREINGDVGPAMGPSFRSRDDAEFTAMALTATHNAVFHVYSLSGILIATFGASADAA